MSSPSVPAGSSSQTTAGITAKQESEIKEDQISKEQADVQEEPGTREELAEKREEVAPSDEMAATDPEVSYIIYSIEPIHWHRSVVLLPWARVRRLFGIENKITVAYDELLNCFVTKSS